MAVLPELPTTSAASDHPATRVYGSGLRPTQSAPTRLFGEITSSQLMAWSRRQSGSEFGDFDACPFGLVTIKGCCVAPAETAPANAVRTPDVRFLNPISISGSSAIALRPVVVSSHAERPCSYQPLQKVTINRLAAGCTTASHSLRLT